MKRCDGEQTTRRIAVDNSNERRSDSEAEDLGAHEIGRPEWMDRNKLLMLPHVRLTAASECDVGRECGGCTVCADSREVGQACV